MKKVPFPQANSIELIFNILNDIGNEGISKLDVSKKYSINERQGAYYLDTLLYLEFVQKINTKYFLTRTGVEIRLSPYDHMKNKFIEEILKHDVIGMLYHKTKDLDKSEKKNIISNYLLTKLDMSLSTANRRANSIVSWFVWIDAIEREGISNE